MQATKTRSDINDYRNDNFIFNVLDSLKAQEKRTDNYGWMRAEDLMGKMNLTSQSQNF